jgi:hypothetical protein
MFFICHSCVVNIENQSHIKKKQQQEKSQDKASSNINIIFSFNSKSNYKRK